MDAAESPAKSLLRRPAVQAGAALALVAVGWLIFSGSHPDQSSAETTASNAVATASSSRNAIPGKGGTGPASSANASSSQGNASTLAETALPFNKSRHYPAALAVAGMDEDETRVEAIEALMETWVAFSPKQAADWAGSLPAGTFRDDALSSLMFHWGARDPAEAASWMTRTGVDDGEAASVLAGTWAAQNPAAAAAWAGNMGNLESRRIATSSVASAWAATAPDAAAAYADSLPESDRASAITAVLTTWGQSNPAAAAAWLKSTPFSNENERATAVATLITPWTNQSPAAASKFINSLPEGPAREAAASQFAVTAAPNAPAEALMWAMNLADPEQRNQVVTDACESWFEGSPETFRQGIAEALGLMEDPAMRRSVYEMLYERDPSFQTNLLQLVDASPNTVSGTPAPAPAPAPAAGVPAAPAQDPALLLPPPDRPADDLPLEIN